MSISRVPTPEDMERVKQFTRVVTAEVITRKDRIEVRLKSNDPQYDNIALQLKDTLVTSILGVLSMMGVTGKHIIYD